MLPHKKEDFKKIKDNFLVEFKKKRHCVSYKSYDFNKTNNTILDLYKSTVEGYSFIYKDKLYLKLNVASFSPNQENIIHKNKEEAFDFLKKNGTTNIYPDEFEHDIHFFGSSILINMCMDMNYVENANITTWWAGSLIIPSTSKIYKEFHPKKFSFVVIPQDLKAYEVCYNNNEINLLLSYSKYCEIEPKFEFSGFIENEKYFRYQTYCHQDLRHGLRLEDEKNKNFFSASNFLTYFNGEYSRIGYDSDDADNYDKGADIARKVAANLNLSDIIMKIYPSYLKAYSKSPIEVVNGLFNFDRSTSRRDEWFMNYDLSLNPEYIKYTKIFFKDLIEILKDKKQTILLCSDIEKLYKHREVGSSHGLQKKFPKEYATNLTNFTEFINLVLLLYYSEDGLYVPSIDSRTGKIHKIEIKIDKEKINSLFFQIIYDQILLVDIHHVYDGTKMLTETLDYDPVAGNKKEFRYFGKEYLKEIDQDSINIFEGIGLDGDLVKSEQLCRDIIHEAINNKIWTIPYQAVVDVKFGNFNSVILTEYKNKVFFLLNHNQNISFFGSLDIDTDLWKININISAPGLDIGIPDKEFNQISDEFLEKADKEKIEAEMSIKLLIASLIRDFWVVEVRESVFKFEKKSVKRKINGQQTRQIQIRYIPRIKYIKKLNVSNTQRSLSYESRRAHWVVAHLRKIEGTAPDFRIALAKNYGFEIKPGFTFVKPFEKGGLKGKNIIYRSKSATKLLFNEDTKILPGNDISDWFKFELDVKKWFERNDFEVEHTGGAGDGGKDLIATKKENNKKISYYIQCKCTSKPVGVEVARELLGTLTDEYPKNTQGIIITNSNFTKEAEALSLRNNIGLIDYRSLFGNMN